MRFNPLASNKPVLPALDLRELYGEVKYDIGFIDNFYPFRFWCARSHYSLELVFREFTSYYFTNFAFGVTKNRK